MTTKTKVLHTIRQGKIGGGETHVINLIEQLNRDRFESLVLSFTDGPMVDKMKAMGIKTFVIETERPFDFSKWRLVEKILLDEKIDILHAHGTRANSNSFYGARRRGIPLVYTVHGWSFHPDQNFVLKGLRMFGEAQLIKRSDLTICVSDSNLLDGKSFCKMDRATVIKSGIDMEKFDFEKNFTKLRDEFHIGEREILVGYIVRMTKQKDPFTLIKAIAIIPEDTPMKFLFVGEGDLKDESIALAKKLKVYHRIIFTEFRQDVPDILNAIDIYCLPSLWEGLPIGLLEAMAMKKAVVATSIDGTKEVIEHMNNGILVPVASPKILAEALVMIASNPELLKRLGLNAFQTIKRDYSIARMTRQIEDAYVVLEDSRKRPFEK
jgi:glycosyltransferase involved in cell wall biosynthesis